MKAIDIHNCENCPLYHNECIGEFKPGADGMPIETPCCSWNDDDEIFNGMYDYDDSDYPTKWDIRRTKEDEERQKEEMENYRLERKENLRQLVYEKTKYGTTKTRDYGRTVHSWFCNKCNRWVYPYFERIHDGIVETYCPRCGETLVCCNELDEEVM